MGDGSNSLEERLKVSSEWDDTEIEGYAEDNSLLSQALKVTKAEYSIDYGVVDFEDIMYPEYKKRARKKTVNGLRSSVKQLGILQPIHVMISEGYSDYVEEHGSDEGFEGMKYILLDGFRRIWAGIVNGITRCNAIIWDFKDKEKGSDIQMYISAMLNKYYDQNWNEKWYLFQLFEELGVKDPSFLELLLSLHPGESSKLKDVMTCPYQEVLDALDKKGLEAAYNLLQKKNKEIDLLDLEDASGLEKAEPAEGIIDTDDTGSDMDSESALKQMTGDWDELSDEDFDEAMGINDEDYGQTVGERHPLDPELRAAVLERDHYRCAVTGRGADLPMDLALSLLNVHHIIPVHCHGKDEMDNLITVSMDLHTLIHVLERKCHRMGKVKIPGMNKEKFDSLSESEKKFIWGARNLAQAAIEADIKADISHEDLLKSTNSAVRFQMPGTAMKENMDSVEIAKQREERNNK